MDLEALKREREKNRALIEKTAQTAPKAGDLKKSNLLEPKQYLKP